MWPVFGFVFLCLSLDTYRLFSSFPLFWNVTVYWFGVKSDFLFSVWYSMGLFNLETDVLFFWEIGGFLLLRIPFSRLSFSCSFLFHSSHVLSLCVFALSSGNFPQISLPTNFHRSHCQANRGKYPGCTHITPAEAAFPGRNSRRHEH